jgi:hypothetical protein
VEAVGFVMLSPGVGKKCGKLCGASLRTNNPVKQCGLVVILPSKHEDKIGRCGNQQRIFLNDDLAITESARVESGSKQRVRTLWITIMEPIATMCLVDGNPLVVEMGHLILAYRY